MGKLVIVEYEVKPDRLDDLVMALNHFVQAVRTNEPGVLRYEAFRRGKSLEFIHLMEFVDDAVETAHKDMPHTKQFVTQLFADCVRQPVLTSVVAIGPGRKIDS